MWCISYCSSQYDNSSVGKVSLVHGFRVQSIMVAVAGKGQERRRDEGKGRGGGGRWGRRQGREGRKRKMEKGEHPFLMNRGKIPEYAFQDQLPCSLNHKNRNCPSWKENCQI